MMTSQDTGPQSVATSQGNWVWVPPAQSSLRELSELLAELRRRRRQLLVVFLTSGLLAFGGSLLMPRLYRSATVLVPVRSQPTVPLAGLNGPLSGLAGMAGLTLPTLSASQDIATLATLRSRTFQVEFAKRRGMVPELFVLRFDEKEERWRTGLFSFGGEPSDDEIYEALGDAISVEQDIDTGLVTVSVLAREPQSARDWAAALIADLNEQMRIRDVTDAERSIEFLKRQIASTDVAELRQAFYGLIEDRTKTVMLAQVSSEYAMRTIDPPGVPDEPAKPRPLLLGVLAAAFASLAFLVWILAGFALRPY